ncbi:hypothetical protein [Bradyrhizobium ottawaense]
MSDKIALDDLAFPERMRPNACRAAATAGEAVDEKELKSAGLRDLQALRQLWEHGSRGD